MIELKNLITDKTPILNLGNSQEVSDDEKNKVIDLNVDHDSYLFEEYLRHMFYKDDNWYYFKTGWSSEYPFSIIDELLGSYLAEERNLDTVKYHVARNHFFVGLASVNFKTPEYKYMLMSDMIKDIFDGPVGFLYLNILEEFPIDETNKNMFMSHLFDLFALDIYMLQRDRGNVNLQFKEDKNTGYFDLAPIYDYARCSSNIPEGGISTQNKIVFLNDSNIIRLAKEYPLFYEKLMQCFNQNMAKTWDRICDDYNFNKDTAEYDRVYDYYQLKDERQKKYLEQIIKHI